MWLQRTISLTIVSVGYLVLYSILSPVVGFAWTKFFLLNEPVYIVTLEPESSDNKVTGPIIICSALAQVHRHPFPSLLKESSPWTKCRRATARIRRLLFKSREKKTSIVPTHSFACLPTWMIVLMCVGGRLGNCDLHVSSFTRFLRLPKKHAGMRLVIRRYHRLLSHASPSRT